MVTKGEAGEGQPGEIDFELQMLWNSIPGNTTQALGISDEGYLEQGPDLMNPACNIELSEDNETVLADGVVIGKIGGVTEDINPLELQERMVSIWQGAQLINVLNGSLTELVKRREGSEFGNRLPSMFANVVARLGVTDIAKEYAVECYTSDLIHGVDNEDPIDSTSAWILGNKKEHNGLDMQTRERAGYVKLLAEYANLIQEGAYRTVQFSTLDIEILFSLSEDYPTLVRRYRDWLHMWPVEFAEKYRGEEIDIPSDYVTS
jgi:hypothetical protein